MTEAWFIEAPGKARQLEAMLAKLGRPTRVQATKGHFMSLPGLDQIGIDRGFNDFLRAPTDMVLFNRIRDVAREADAVFIATDADAEGDVIAWDVACAIRDIHDSPTRVRLKGIDAESLTEAIAAAGLVREADAVAGRTRAIIDRLIGAAFAGRGVAVGRVGTAMLGVIQRDKPSVWRLQLVAPATDGGRPWRAQLDVKAPLDKAGAERLAALTLPVLDFNMATTKVTPPGHMGDIMLRAADRLDMSPAETSRAMQRSYESGRLSYPRSGSRAVSRSVARKLRKMMMKEGYRFEEKNVAEKGEAETHDAPHPLGDVVLSHDPQQMGADEGVRVLIGRDLVRAGQAVTLEAPATTKLREFLLAERFPASVAELVANLPWGRERGPAAPGQDAWGESQLVQRRPDAAMLEACLKAGLGRPSTWAEHVEKFMSRGLVDGELQLTDKGRLWIERSPKELLNPLLSVGIERACENGHPRMHEAGKPAWEFLAEKIVSVLPAGVKAPLADLVASIPPQARRDFIAEAEAARPVAPVESTPGAGIDFEALERSQAPQLRPED